MRLQELRKRLPIVASLPEPDDRKLGPRRRGEIPRPRFAVWELTLACDHRCLHCGSRAGKARKNELTTEECLDVVRQLRELGVGEVALIGGEAYLRNDFILVIRAIRTAGMLCTMTTGARGLTVERIEAMREAGISSVSISIDGLAATHDRLRGVPGSHANAFEVIGRLRAAGIPVAANTQINRLTMHELEPLLDELVRAGIYAWQLQITSPFGNAADHPEVLLQPYMMLEVFDTLARIVPRARRRGIAIWTGNNLGYFGPLEGELRSGGQKHYKGCAAGRFQIGLEADGAVKGCPSLGGAENVAGNVRQHTLADLWSRSAELAYTRERTTNELWGYCGECYYADVCRGGCTATAEPLMGRPGNNPFCHHRALEMDRMGMRERIELVARAPGRPFDHGLYRIVREPVDAQRRRTEGPTQIDEPRISRLVERMGAGRPV